MILQMICCVCIDFNCNIQKDTIFSPYRPTENLIQRTNCCWVKASVGQADVQRFEPHLGHNWLSCGVFLVKTRHFRLPLAQTQWPNWQSLLAGGSVAIQTWSIYKVYT